MNIKDYLHLYIGNTKIQYGFDGATKIGTLSGYNELCGWQVFRAEVILAPHVYVRDELIKPILRRLETMTEKENVEIDDAYEDFKKKDKYSKNAVIKWAALHTSILLSKHFDLFGLIDAGLAIDAATLPNSDKNDAVSDTTGDPSSNADGVQKILSDFGKRISGEAKSKTPLTEEAFKEELEKQYPLQGMKPNRFRQQGAMWLFTNYIQPLLSELAEAKKENERLKSQLDTVKKQWGIFK